MSKPIEEMTKTELIDTLQDVLEWNQQWVDVYCPWCDAEDYGVDSAGERTDDNPVEYHCDHASHCAVTLIKNIFSGEYVYLNNPQNGFTSGPKYDTL